MPLISEVAVRSYYRVSVAGARLPTAGPVLIVANHNNALVDPALVAAVSPRNVRFLAKAPLVTHPIIGWLVRGVGSVPVYRQQDDPTLVSQNLDSFRDVHRVLAGGDVVGIFPEGISHTASRLAPLKTGAARIAIGAATQLGHSFPIVAMGLVFRDRDTFRSEAHVIVAEPFAWDDLVGDIENRTAVRELTARIERAMRTVSLNLEAWEDEPLVRTAEAVWRAEFHGDLNPAATLARLRVTTEALARLRTGNAQEWQRTASHLRAHGHTLAQLGLTPDSLRADVTLTAALRWLGARLPLLPLLPISLAGALFFWIPKRLTTALAAWVARREQDESIVTYRILGGAIIFPLWAFVSSGVIGSRWGWTTGLLSLILQPVWAVAALLIGERRQSIWIAIRRYVLRWTLGEQLAALRSQQHALARELRALLDADSSIGPNGSTETLPHP
jgi:glycerol-3-phosphate O-acyltransferase/dihydroxyacetone phosphate acyltransferase